MKFLPKPRVRNIIVIKNTDEIAVKLSITIDNSPYVQDLATKDIRTATAPYQNFHFFSRTRFKIKVLCLDNKSEVLSQREFNTDKYSNVSFKIPRFYNDQEVSNIQIFEIKFNKGVDVLLGSFIPINLLDPKKIIISDFDKTLVDTKYSNLKEVFHSLSKPISFFPTVKEGLGILKQAIKRDYVPFILSASPHFYEKPFRDWLYQNQVFTSSIFLKDYRKVLSPFDSELTPKDLKVQGYYKLQELISILLMTNIPDSCILIGDGFESDPIVYLIIRSILIEKHDPWSIWKAIKKSQKFKLTRAQQSRLLTSLNLLSSLAQKKEIKLKIYIRCYESNIESIQKSPTNIDFLDQQKENIFYFTA